MALRLINFKRCNMTNRKNTINKISAILLIIISLLSTVFTPLTAFASATVKSSVIEDLSADSEFNVADYPLMSYDTFVEVNSDDDPDNNVDYIQVIQIAENENNELFVYTYQPLNNVSDITATSISFATEESALKDMAIKNDMTGFKKYELECVSAEGSLKKYKVKDFKVGNGYYRYYCISEIERPFDTLLDEKISDTTITDYKAHTVAQAWCCYYYDNTLQYEMVTLDVVEITPTYTGELLYKDGVTWGSIVGMSSTCESHYISFNVDNYKVDKIIDASLVYKYREYKMVHTLDVGIAPTISSWFGKDVEHTVTSYPNGTDYKTQPIDIYETDQISYEGKGLWAKEYSWNRIMTGTAFVEKFEDQGGEWNETIKETVKNSQFVFAFCETPLETWQTSSTSGDGGVGSTTTYVTTAEGTEIAKVDILRLKFVSNGVTYNLGVVCDTTSSDGKADGVADDLEIDMSFFNETFEKIISIIMLLVLVVLIVNVFVPVILPLFKLLVNIVSAIVSVIVSIVTFPFRLITRKRKW